MTRLKFTLEDKVALIAGGGRGIGRTLALAFAEAGAHVAVVSRTLPELEKVTQEVHRYGRRGLAVKADLTQGAEVEQMVEQVLQEFGRIDVLVNCAATNLMRPLLELPEKRWEQILNTCLKSYFLCSQAVGRKMKERRGGCIINLASTAAQKATPGMGAYCIAKAGVVMLTQVLALELAPYNIRVNAIAPGVVRTGFSEPLWSNPELLKKLLPPIPLGRIAEPEDLVGLALFLASDASSYITGQTIYIDGGISAE